MASSLPPGFVLDPLGPPGPRPIPRVIQGPPREAPLHSQETPAEVTIDQGRAAAAPYDAPAAAAGVARTNQQIQQGDTRGANFADENALRTQFLRSPAVQNYETVMPMFASALQAGDGGAGDLQIIYAFGKAMDPGSVVRESEQQMAAQSGGMIERMQGWIQSINDGGRLPAGVRERLLSEIRTRASVLGDAYRLARADATRNAQRYGFDPQSIIGQNAGLPYQQVEATYLGRPVRNMDGSQGASPRGTQPGQPGAGEHAQFWDEGQPAPPGAADFQTALQTRLQSGAFTTPEQIIEFGRNYHLPDGTPQRFDIRPDQAEAAVRARGRATVNEPTFQPPDISDARGGGGAGETADATVRSAANAALAGIPDRLAAAGDTLFSGGTYDENLRRQHAITGSDWENHPYASTAGTIAGAAAIPTGMVGASRAAATQAIRQGLPRINALNAAREAGAVRLGQEGGAYGALYGYNTSERPTVGGRLLDAGLGAVSGAVPAYGLGQLGPAGRIGQRGRMPPLVGETGRLNEPLQSASPAQRMGAAREFGIDLPLDAATDRGGAILGRGFDILPASAGVMNDARRVTEGQVTNAVEDVAGRFGNSQTPYAGGQQLQQGARDWISRFEQASSHAYSSIPISPNATAALDNTRAALGEMTTRFQSNPELARIMQNPQLQRYQAALESGGLSWNDLKNLRSHIGNEIGEARFSDSPTRTDLRGLYGALSEDMRATAAAQGPRALRSFERANNLYREGQQRIDGALVAILGNDSANSPEAAARLLQTIARGGRGSSNLGQLAAIRASMHKGGEWNEVASSLIRLMGQPVNSEGRAFNPQTFVQNYSDMSEPARALLFGGTRELRSALDRFVAVNQRLAGTNALRNTSNTAPGITAAATVSSVGVGIMNPVAGASMVAGMGATFGLSKLWTNPRFVNWATGYTQMMARRGGNQRGGYRALVGQRRALASLARSTPSLTTDINALDQQLFGSDAPAP